MLEVDLVMKRFDRSERGTLVARANLPDGDARDQHLVRLAHDYLFRYLECACAPRCHIGRRPPHEGAHHVARVEASARTHLKSSDVVEHACPH